MGGPQEVSRIAYNCHAYHVLLSTKQQITSFNLLDFVNKYDFLVRKCIVHQTPSLDCSFVIIEISGVFI